MTTELNGYILTDKVKNDMRSKLDDTQQDELGFALCSEDNIIIEGEHTKGTPNGITIDLSMCKKGEKFLGGYHTHPIGRGDSYASAGDLIHCGRDKIICIGGKTDNKIRCNTWKYKQLSSEDINKMRGYTNNTIPESERLIYQQTFDCSNIILPLLSEEEDIKKLNKDLGDMESLLSDSRRHMTVESITRVRNALNMLTEIKNIRANRLVREIEDKSNRYYNKLEIY
jgi:hypothetical protein